MIKLYQYPPMFGLPNPSPFCMKLETWLRMTGLPFEIERIVDPRKGPKGKVPWVDDQGKKIADSAFIIEHLENAYGKSPETTSMRCRHRSDASRSSSARSRRASTRRRTASSRRSFGRRARRRCAGIWRARAICRCSVSG